MARRATSKTVIYAAMAGNALVAMSKLFAASWTGSAAMTAEAVHSMVDAGNEALLLHGLGLDVSLFTPTFAISRVSGWIAHAFEQKRANRIIRPQSEYVGPRDLHFVPVGER